VVVSDYVHSLQSMVVAPQKYVINNIILISNIMKVTGVHIRCISLGKVAPVE